MNYYIIKDRNNTVGKITVFENLISKFNKITKYNYYQIKNFKIYKNDQSSMIIINVYKKTQLQPKKNFNQIYQQLICNKNQPLITNYLKK